MKCLVINLDRSGDRLAHITSEFAKIDVPFERVPAIDVHAVIRASKLTNAETACFLSHRRCWQIIADGADQFGAIFEDDVVFSDEAGSLLADTSWVPRDADIVKLETFFVAVRLGRQQTSLGNGYSLVSLSGTHVGAAGYIVSKAAAQRLLRWTKRLKAPVDHVIFDPGFMACARSTVYQLTPAICAQSQFFVGNKHRTLIQNGVPHRQRNWRESLAKETSRLVALLRNGAFRRTEKVDAVAFGRHQPEEIVPFKVDAGMREEARRFMERERASRAL
jgi:glycosyl transferase family 25